MAPRYLAGSASLNSIQSSTWRESGEAAAGQIENAEAVQAREQLRLPGWKHALSAAQLGHPLQLARAQQLRHKLRRYRPRRRRARQLYPPHLRANPNSYINECRAETIPLTHRCTC